MTSRSLENATALIPIRVLEARYQAGMAKDTPQRVVILCLDYG